MAKPAEIKTKENDASIEDFISSLPEQKQSDSLQIMKLMEAATGEKPKMWGKAMIGYGKLRYKSPTSGREVDWFKIGFSPRKDKFSLHLVGDVNAQTDLLDKLGKFKTGMGCLYINKLADVDVKVLEGLIRTMAKKKN